MTLGIGCQNHYASGLSLTMTSFLYEYIGATVGREQHLVGGMCCPRTGTKPKKTPCIISGAGFEPRAEQKRLKLMLDQKVHMTGNVCWMFEHQAKISVRPKYHDAWYVVTHAICISSLSIGGLKNLQPGPTEALWWTHAIVWLVPESVTPAHFAPSHCALYWS